MDQQNIDRLFREKLSDFEITPAAKSWSEVEKRVGRKNKPAVYWIAASITLVLVSWVLWPESADVVGIASQEIDHPIQSTTSLASIPVAAELRKVTPQAANAVNVVKTPQVQLIAEEEIKEVIEQQKEVLVVPELEKKAAIAMEEIEPETTGIQDELIDATPKLSTVKITYIASNTASNRAAVAKNDSTGVLKKFIAFTEKLDPGEMLADIKTAKDNLLSSGFKSKKDRSVMTP